MVGISRAVRDRDVAHRAPRDGFTASLEISTMQSSRVALKETVPSAGKARYAP